MRRVVLFILDIRDFRCRHSERPAYADEVCRGLVELLDRSVTPRTHDEFSGRNVHHSNTIWLLYLPGNNSGQIQKGQCTDQCFSNHYSFVFWLLFPSCSLHGQGWTIRRTFTDAKGRIFRSFFAAPGIETECYGLFRRNILQFRNGREVDRFL